MFYVCVTPSQLHSAQKSPFQGSLLNSPHYDFHPLGLLSSMSHFSLLNIILDFLVR